MPKPQPTSLSLAEYALKAGGTNRFKDNPNAFESLRFGYFGEVGGLLSSVKKAGRDQLSVPQSELAAEELGDALWYLINVARHLNVTPDQIGEECIRELRRRLDEGEKEAITPVTFRHIDSLIEICRGNTAVNRSEQLGKLAVAAGQLAGTSDGQYQSLSQPNRCSHFGGHLADLAQSCASFDLRIEDVARFNLRKIASRWPGENQDYPPLFDEGCLLHEQFPRKFSMNYVERGTEENRYVVQSMNGVNIGSRLTDNSNEPDDYRFHDVFHLAYATYLGWSPVLRALLKLKRKSDPKIDENEDGARAIIIEEGIATWIFNHAKDHSFYSDARAGSLDYGLLKQIQSMVQGYEVEQCGLWQWEKAILKGFEVFRKLRESRGGTVTIDLEEHTMDFTPFTQNKQQ